MKAFFLKLLPYLISLLGGVVVYIIAEMHIGPETGVYGLVTGVASGLLSIPLIFICYEGVNRICSRRLRRSLFEHLSYEINGVIIDVLGRLKAMLGVAGPLNRETMRELLGMTSEEIRSRLTLSLQHADALEKARDDLLSSVSRHTHAHSDLLTHQETETLLSLSRELGTLVREIRHQSELPEAERNLDHPSENIRRVLEVVSDWVGECEDEALLNHIHLRYIGR